MSERQPSSRSCFVCGRDNPLGLRTRWVSDRAEGVVRSEVVIPEHFNGFPGVVHGGVLAAILDEGLVRTALLDGGFDDLMVTARMEVVFRRPVPTETPVTFVARLVRRVGARAECEAEVRLPDGTVAARATALLAQPPAQVKAGWDAERPYWTVDPE
jgi:acyl-coenzyme A thioesterase PaaI-like protein